MNYVQFHLGDWIAGTSLLSATERGVYMDLLVRYYKEERPIMQMECKRIARAYAPNEQEAMQYVLETFFTLESDGYHHKRCEEEIAKAQAVTEKRKRAAESRWGKGRKETDEKEQCADDANAMQEQCKSNADGVLTNNQEPITSNQINKDVPSEKTRRSSKKNGTRLSIETLPDKWKEFCEKEEPELDPQRVFDNFRNYWASRSGKDAVKADWLATWCNCVMSYRNAPNWKRNPMLRTSVADDQRKNNLGQKINGQTQLLTVDERKKANDWGLW